tara:strand:+ start:241 stop:708 length:468 start_codon:yes stop_codon:yes gene_type:complete
MSADKRIDELNLQLPPAPKPGGVYQPVLVCGNMAYVSGHGPLRYDESYITGRVGETMDTEAAKAAARQTGLAILASLRAKFGSLDRVERLVKSFGMVNATPDFGQHPQVINGYSELMADVFGAEKGLGSRSAVGMGSLPNNIAVEIEAVFEIRPE